MERDEINEFIEELKEENIFSTEDADELKGILEISAKDIETKNLSKFLKNVKENIKKSI